MSNKKDELITYQPLADKIIIDFDPVETERNGIRIPDGSQKPRNTGKIVAVGPGVVINGTLVAPTVKPGQRVVTFPTSGYPVEHEGKTCYIIKEHEILAVEK